ncbi:uncharacterized protein PV09_09478 [Verruconis gallopava]|uniref:Integrase catalytic domain-containing protein n=1 Tax=Verruconis gallopava TaxID=253628 RepID=A0A0D2AI27_9PEZI|nr:uncharacterized protein PV09_09639 [Verruconis gallopava]XP_016208651.1 uncharacterized protein PV09_09478 [Verruconis gallopava]KIV98558.1 hypothetical protein PV09_09639 [Verruconis gallopava]KIV98781.1 hypothetical protein PV09_09478 [Verruconis gallopava]
MKIFGLPKGIVSDRDPKFTSEFWSELCYMLHIRKRMGTAFHPQTDGQTERQNQTIQEYLRAYCGQYQKTWAKLLPIAEFAYNNSVNASTGTTPFFALYGFHPEIYYDIETQSKVPDVNERVKQLHDVRKKLEEYLANASKEQAKYYNRRHEPMAFKTNDLVLLSTKHLRLKQPSKKLAPRFVGPFRILEPVGTQAYRLQLPASWKVWNTFHVSLLEKYHQREGGENTANQLPLPEIIDDEEEWEVEEILDKKKHKNGMWYLVKWKGYPTEYNQWLPRENLDNAQEMRDEFDNRAKRRRTRRATNEDTIH